MGNGNCGDQQVGKWSLESSKKWVQENWYFLSVWAGKFILTYKMSKVMSSLLNETTDVKLLTRCLEYRQVPVDGSWQDWPREWLPLTNLGLSGPQLKYQSSDVSLGLSPQPCAVKGREMDQSVKRVLYKPEDLSLNLQHLQKKASVVALACNPITAHTHTLGHGPGLGSGGAQIGKSLEFIGQSQSSSMAELQIQ